MVAAMALLHQSASAQSVPASLTLATGGRTDYVIVLDDERSETTTFAAAELASYFREMTGAPFPVVHGRSGDKAIVLKIGGSAGATGLTGEAYAITVRGETLFLTGGSPRALLFAVYDLLARLGCRWLAPDLEIYGGHAEVVPRTTRLRVDLPGDVIERPVFAIRKLDVESGLSHDESTLARIIDWMPKARFNTLQAPMNFGGSGRARWDDWRAALAPELKKRDLVVEVGGHGYQNFLNDEMGEGRLFEEHPDWFGLDDSCEPSRNERHVFNTANPDAVDYLLDNVETYLVAHPEIDVFDFWPPDGARWAECERLEALGSPENRQARLANALQERLRQVRPDLRLEIIAYAMAKQPPTVDLDPDILVDFCPIGQNFDVPIYDPRGANNAVYVDAIRDWRARFSGDISVYSYYRKYAWKSLPNLIPHYMQRDLQWYATIPLQGVSSYAEPGDWYTYELNHYVLGHLAWDPDADVSMLVDEFVQARYGPAAEVAARAVTALEETVRPFGNIKYSALDAPDDIARGRARLQARLAEVRSAVSAIDVVRSANLHRLALMLDYAIRDLDIQHARMEGAPAPALEAQVGAMLAFLEEHQDEGVFLLTGRNDRARMMHQYGLDGTTPSPSDL